MPKSARKKGREFLKGIHRAGKKPQGCALRYRVRINARERLTASKGRGRLGERGTNSAGGEERALGLVPRAAAELSCSGGNGDAKFLELGASEALFVGAGVALDDLAKLLDAGCFAPEFNQS